MVSIKFNNHYNNNDKDKQQSKEIEINDCTITNYDPSKKSPSGAGDMTLNIQDGKAEYKRGQSIFNGEDVKLNQKKYSVFTKIASMDKNGANLTQQDLSNARKDYDKNKDVWLKLGVTEFRYDPNAGIATIKFGDKELLRIDFVTEKEKAAQTEQPNNTKISAKATKAEIKSGEKPPSTAQGSNSPTQKPQATNSNNDVDSVISKFTGGNIDISKVKDLATVAQYTGISEDYIKEILVGIEGDKKYPLCKAEYDGVPGKGHPKGYLTIGFGHTALTGAPKPTADMKITEKQAYQILANDIITARKYARAALRTGDGRNLFDESPKSIQNALIDIAFNKGPSEVKDEHLVANLKLGYYGAASRRTWYDTTNVGLQKRNMYRFLESIKDTTNDTKCAAIKRFYGDHVQQLQNVFKKDINAKVAWNTACNTYGVKDYIC